ncbi:hypothetical protein N0V91_010407 [Didymella pomorum]|uniref:Uncharacterized protein n=1 Tax=Didymella pomorum TaxID=749634 RepID=A0A9W9D232_9PLEO|nr:hypothetical protein N0V91_010407 [Didymella pomorum]
MHKQAVFLTIATQDKHLKAITHTGQEQLSRALKLRYGPDVPSPISACNATTNKKRKKTSGFVDHTKMWHPEQLWEDDEEVKNVVAAG